MQLSEFTVQQLERAVAIKQQIESLQQQLNALMNGTEDVAAPSKGSRSSVEFDSRTESLKRAREARWAKYRANKEPSTVSPAPNSAPAAKTVGKKRGPMSPEQKALLAKIAKARWDKIRSAQPKPSSVR
jgi:hypothetical protein